MAQYTQTNTTTTTTQTTTAVNQGTQLTVGTYSTTSSVGNFVSDITVQPYIKNTIISFFAYNMRPNQNLHIFFDSILVDQYCAPGTIANSSSIDTSTYTSVNKTGNWGDTIRSDAKGQVAGQFNIPDSQFRVGDRVLQIADVTNLAQGNDAITTLATVIVTANPNISVTKQTLTLTTVNPVLNFTPVTNTVITSVSNTTFASSNTLSQADTVGYNFHFFGPNCPGNDPIAQSLKISLPDNEAGVFATSLTLYFKQKSQVNNGISVYLCEMLNGYPNGLSILPFSIVHLNNSNINVSNNASVGTTFTFESPVFMNNDTMYAFVVKPDASDPDFQVYSARLGDVDLVTNAQVSSQPIIGTAFYGASVATWTALQTEYIKFDFNIAKFTSGSGSVTFNNSDTDYLTVYNLQYSNNQYKLLTGDIVFQATNSTISTVNTNIKGVVDYYDDYKYVLHVANTTGNFSGNSFVQIHRFSNNSSQNPNTSTLIATANTFFLLNPRINALMPEFATITPSGTSLSFNYSGSSNNGTLDSNPVSVTLGYETSLYDYERAVYSKTRENGLLSGSKSLTINGSLFTDSPYVSPVIDVIKSDVLAIKNRIDDIVSVYEEFYNNGASSCKYISQIITLAPGQDAQDIQVVVSAHIPPSTQVQVWVKLLNGQDSENINNKTWTPLGVQGNMIYCDPSNPNDYKEYTFGMFEKYPMISTTGTITTSNTSNTVTGSGTLFGYEVHEGWYIGMKSNSSFNEITRKIVSISSNTSMTLEQPFIGNYTNTSYFIVPPPTTAYMSNSISNKLTGTVSTSTSNNSIIGYSTSFAANTSKVNNSTDAINITNANTYFAANDAVYYFVPSGNSAIQGLVGNTMYYVASANTTGITLSVSPGGTTIDLTAPTTNPGETHLLQKTVFTQQLRVGSIINVENDNQEVISIANNTFLTVGTPWSSDNSNALAYVINNPGATYSTSSGSVFTTFKKFQIKVLLYSNDTSKVPTIDNLRALALQL